MHEQALLRELVRQVDAVAEAHGSRRVNRVRLRIGALCHLTPQLLRSRWPEVAAHSRAREAFLEIERSDAIDDPDAQHVRLQSIVVEEPSTPSSS